jgi:hypothetical protein
MKVLVCRQNEFSLVSVVMSSAVVGFVATALIRRWYSQSSEVDDEDDFEDGDDESFADKKKLNSDFPPHLRRAVYKKKRRKESVRKSQCTTTLKCMIQMEICFVQFRKRRQIGMYGNSLANGIEAETLSISRSNPKESPRTCTTNLRNRMCAYPVATTRIT